LPGFQNHPFRVSELLQKSLFENISAHTAHIHTVVPLSFCTASKRNSI
jgi:hypothetical protein